MIKKRLFILMLAFTMILSPSIVDAATTITMNDKGNYYKRGPYYDPDRDAIRYEFNTMDLKKSKIEYYHTKDLTNRIGIHDNTASPGNFYSHTSFYCVGFYRQTFYSDNGTLLISFVTEVKQGDVKGTRCEFVQPPKEEPKPDPEPEPKPDPEPEPKPDPKPDPEPEPEPKPDPDPEYPPGGEYPGEGEGVCDDCAIFDCPGWSEYMGMLEQIRAAIPPPPNWYEVADIFRDSIAPRIKQDMADLIGSAPEPVMPTLPNTPTAPTTPAQLPPLDDHGLSAPTGEEAPGLGDAGFTSSKIKDAAPEIEFREDPTGGFSIIDPVSSLPSQEEFRKNAPKEGEVSLPGAPYEPENIAPTPDDTTDAPPKPDESTNTAPFPDPLPGSVPYTAPIPGDTDDAPPYPDDLKDKAPIPGDNTEVSPTPGEKAKYKPPF